MSSRPTLLLPDKSCLANLETGVVMAVQGPIPVEFGQVFPRGVFAAGGFEPVRDFEASKAGRFVQSKDKQSGLPLWVIDVIDADPAARDKSVRVKVAAADQPVLPAAPAGLPFV